MQKNPTAEKNLNEGGTLVFPEHLQGLKILVGLDYDSNLHSRRKTQRLALASSPRGKYFPA